VRSAAVLALIVLWVSPVFSQEQPVALWNDLQRGDQADIVAAKLKALPEVKRAKVKPPRKSGAEPSVDLDYSNDGLKIFDQSFKLTARFSDGGLQVVHLTTGQECRNLAFGEYRRLVATLIEKYPDPVRDDLLPKDQPGWLQAELDEFNGLRGVVRTALTDGKTTVHLTVDMVTIPQPVNNFSLNAIAQALNNLAQSIYNMQVQACGGTGDRRAIFNISYMAAAEYEAITGQERELDKMQAEAAKSRL
jgi:hypothetical protein